MRAGPLFAILLLCGCGKVQFDIWKAKTSENFADVFQGRDRGYFGYRRILGEYTKRVPGLRRYQYVPPAHVANYQVQRAVRGLGGTEWPNTDFMAGCVDRLFYVLRYDPTPSARAEACGQLGRLARRIPIGAADPYPVNPRHDEAIRQIASDLFTLQQRLAEGERVKQSVVVASIEKLEPLHPTRLISAMQLMRALSSRPAVLVPDGPLREVLTRVVPPLCRRSISIVLAEVSTGSAVDPRIRPDDAPAVRRRALEVLVALRDPVARDTASARAWDELYPGEQDPHARRVLVEYLGVAGGPRAFEAALRRLDNDEEVSVRLKAQSALIAMTGARVAPDAAAWRGWREERPEWRLPAEPETAR